jgi:D-beta-D-heptose 7-phosphate kinase / D-beta-D-heptose 1-phosphate adenosyltransferase
MEQAHLSFEKSRILIVGDIMLDRYIWGNVQRISPEAPVMVVKKQRVTETLGGAGNVANNLAGLGCQVVVVGVCGHDHRSQVLKQLLRQKGIQDGLIEDPGRPTITKTRIMAHKQQVLRLDEEDAGALSSDLVQQIQFRVTREMAHCQALIISDYGKGTLASEQLVQEIIALARTHTIPVLVDPKGTRWERYRGATCITPNTAELEAMVGAPLEGDDALLIASAREVRNRLALDRLLVTRGAQGMCLLGPEEEPLLIPAQARDVYDVSGAGDTVIATLAAALAGGAAFDQAARVANVAAGIVVGKLGTQPILASELFTALRFNNQQLYYPYAAAKMTAMDAALAKVQEWKAASEILVFTNGCFDLLHPGHISLLYQARALGDRLIVGLNTDASVRRLKGPQRPILQQQDRAAMLSALACVDMVVHFDEDTPLDLIKAIQPHVLVKGSDYNPDQVVGKEVVEAYGGCVKLVDLVKGYSTTQLARKVLSNAKNDAKRPSE